MRLASTQGDPLCLERIPFATAKIEPQRVPNRHRARLWMVVPELVPRQYTAWFD
jgi:hypothetical protein